MPIKIIEIINVQSHEYTKLELNKTGITRLYGENNDGKSVLTKMLDYFIREKIRDPKVRKAMIRKTATYGKLIITKYDGMILTLNLDLEASKTFVKLERPKQETVLRYLADKSYPQLIRLAGFHYNKKNDVTLNIYQTNDPWIFIQTKPTLNYDVLNEAVSDPLVEEGLSNLNKLMKDSKALLNIYSTNISNLQSQYAMLPKDTTEEQTIIKGKCEYFLENIDKLNPPQYVLCKKPIDLKEMEYLTYIAKPLSLELVEGMKIQHKITMINLLTTIPNIEKLNSFVENVTEIQKSLLTLICPTCGRKLYEKGNFTNHHTC